MSKQEAFLHNICCLEATDAKLYFKGNIKNNVFVHAGPWKQDIYKGNMQNHEGNLLKILKKSYESV